MFVRLTHPHFRVAISRDTHAFFVEAGRNIMREWGSLRVGKRIWTVEPYVEGTGGVEFRISVLDEDDTDALDSLVQIARAENFTVEISQRPHAPPPGSAQDRLEQDSASRLTR